MKPTREEALAIASERKAARRCRTSRIRKLVAALAVAAFIGPFAVIYNHMAAGKDPALAAQSTVARVSTSATSGTTTSGASTTTSGSTADSSESTDESESTADSSESTDESETTTGSSESGTNASTQQSAPAAVTTQQS
jgi:hypothetical protein